MRGWEQKMDNSNLWDWDNGEEHIVSSVYRDTEAETDQSAKVQNDMPQNDIAQNAEVQNISAQNNELQNHQAQTASVPENETQASVEQKDAAPSSEPVMENNFILVDNPQNIAQNIEQSIHGQSGASYVQTEYQQTEHPQTQYQQSQHQQVQYQQTEYQQTQYQQTDDQKNNFQQIIPVQNAQQNQGTNRQKQNRNTDYSSQFNPKDISENKVTAMAAYLLGPIGIIIALLAARDSAYTAFHVRQALKITVCSIVLEIIAAVLALFGMIPLVGIIFKLVLVIICAIWLGVLVLRLAAIAQVCDGEAREPAIIGKMNCFH